MEGMWGQVNADLKNTVVVQEQMQTNSHKEEVKDNVYDQLEGIIRNVLGRIHLMLMGD